MCLHELNSVLPSAGHEQNDYFHGGHDACGLGVVFEVAFGAPIIEAGTRSRYPGLGLRAISHEALGHPPGFYHLSLALNFTVGLGF